MKTTHASTKVLILSCAMMLCMINTPNAMELGTTAEIEVSRDVQELRPLMRPDPDVDTLDTALVFHNPGKQRTRVVCAGFDANGNTLDRVFTVIPGNGLRFIRARDLSNGVDFIGSAKCRSRSRVVPSAFVVGAGFSDAPAKVINGWEDTTIVFPVVASY